MKQVRLVYRELPPSSNNIYFQGTKLTREARAYADHFSAWAMQNHGHVTSQLQVDPFDVVQVELTFYFEKVLNEAYFKKGPTYQVKEMVEVLDDHGKPIWETTHNSRGKEKRERKMEWTGKMITRVRSPFLRFDLNNRIKLLEDCVRDFLDIDDSLTFDSNHHKRCDPRDPRVEIDVRIVPCEAVGIERSLK